MIFDLHVHTTHSPCSSLKLAEIIRQAGSCGLDGVAITDHNSMAIRYEVAEGIQENGICLLFGMEYDTPDGDFLLFGPFEDIKLGLSSQELLQIVSARQGVAIGAHPCREGRSLNRNLLEQNACRIVEGLNGRNSEEENSQVRYLAKLYPLFLCGGSDAHAPDELGRSATHFEGKIASRQELIAALKNGRYYPVSDGR